jgi:hypothetical protein
MTTKTDSMIRTMILNAVAHQKEPTEAHLFHEGEQRGHGREDVERVLVAMIDANEVRSTIIQVRGLLGEERQHWPAITAPFAAPPAAPTSTIPGYTRAERIAVAKLVSKARLTALAKEAGDRLHGRVECPDCGSHGPHDDNGDAREPMFCCAGCGMHFEA